MFSVSIISIFFGVVLLAVFKKLYEAVKHYQRPTHFPPGPSQVQYIIKFNVITIRFNLYISPEYKNEGIHKSIIFRCLS